MIPAAMDKVHCVSEGSTAVAAVNVIAAVALPELLVAVVKVVVPHPAVATDESVPNEKDGTVNTMVSSIDRSALKNTITVTADGAIVTGFRNDNTLSSTWSVSA